MGASVDCTYSKDYLTDSYFKNLSLDSGHSYMLSFLSVSNFWFSHKQIPLRLLAAITHLNSLSRWPMPFTLTPLGHLGWPLQVTAGPDKHPTAVMSPAYLICLSSHPLTSELWGGAGFMTFLDTDISHSFQQFIVSIPYAYIGPLYSP